jgi:hypothetical protein
MEKTKQSFIARVKTYLKKSELPYTRIPDTENLLVMRSVGSHHYLLIQFYDMPHNWFEDRKYFDIKVLYGNDIKQVSSGIERYLKGE